MTGPQSYSGERVGDCLHFINCIISSYNLCWFNAYAHVVCLTIIIHIVFCSRSLSLFQANQQLKRVKWFFSEVGTLTQFWWFVLKSDLNAREILKTETRFSTPMSLIWFNISTSSRVFQFISFTFLPFSFNCLSFLQTNNGKLKLNGINVPNMRGRWDCWMRIYGTMS